MLFAVAFNLGKLSVAEAYSPYNGQWLRKLLCYAKYALAIPPGVGVSNIRSGDGGAVPMAGKSRLKDAPSVHGVGTYAKQSVYDGT